MGWLDANRQLLMPVLAIATIVLLVLALVFAFLWMMARRGRRTEVAHRVDLERHAFDLELAIREQLGRLRMVRELHELTIHSISQIIAHADGARYAAQSDSGAAARAASVIADSARNTLADLRRVITVVRAGEADAAPQPRFKTARDLFTVMRDAGLAVVFEESGSPFELKDGAELAIYRILQESLSNALKHGGDSTSVTVAFRWSDQGLRVLVDDDGTRARSKMVGVGQTDSNQATGYSPEDDAAALTRAVSGPGITEMRERTELFGGVFQAYPVPGVGFSIAAVFPIGVVGAVSSAR